MTSEASDRLAATSSAAEVSQLEANARFRQMIETLSRYWAWGVLGVLMVGGGAVAYITFRWEPKAQAEAVIHLRPSQTNNSPLSLFQDRSRNLEGDASLLQSEATAIAVGVLINALDQLTPEEREKHLEDRGSGAGEPGGSPVTRPRASAGAGKGGTFPEVADAQGSPVSPETDSDTDPELRVFRGWLAIDFATGRRVEAHAAVAANGDVLLLSPDDARVLVKSYWGADATGAMRDHLRVLASGPPSGLAEAIVTEGDWSADTITVRATAREPALAVFLANAFPAGFMALVTRNSRVESRQRVSVSDQQLREAERELYQAERSLDTALKAAFEKLDRPPVLAPVAGMERNAISARVGEIRVERRRLAFQISTLKTQLGALRADLAQLEEDRYYDPVNDSLRELNQKLTEEIIEAQSGSPRVQALREQIQLLRELRARRRKARLDAQARVAKLEREFAPLGEQDPAYATKRTELRAAKEALAALQADLNTTPGAGYQPRVLESDIRRLEAELSRLVAEDRLQREILDELLVQEGRLDELNAAARRYKARVAALNKQLEAAATSHQAAKVAATTVEDAYVWQVFASLDTIKEIGPKPIILGAVLLALLVAGLAPQLVAILDARTRTIAHIHRETHLPVLGEIPALRRGEREALARGEPAGRVDHAFAVAAYNLKSLHTGPRSPGAPRGFTLAVTSPAAAEGKSFCAFSLAVAVARQGLRALYVMADRHNPSSEALKRLGIDYSEERGRAAAETLRIGELPLRFDDLVLTTPHARLWAAIAGSTDLDGAAFFESETFHEFRRQAETRFDVIVIDCPPVLPVVDSLVIARQVHSVVVVVRNGRTRRNDLARAVTQLRFVDAPVQATIMNFASKHHSRYTYEQRYAYQAPMGHGVDLTTPPDSARQTSAT